MSDEDILKRLKRAMAEREVAVQWPSLRKDLIERNVDMMTIDEDIVRHANIALQVFKEINTLNPGAEKV